MAGGFEVVREVIDANEEARQSAWTDEPEWSELREGIPIGLWRALH